MIGRSKNHEPLRHQGSRRLWVSGVSCGYLLLLLPWRSHILRKAFQGNLARAGRCFLRFVGCVLDESSFQHIIRFVTATFALASVDGPPKFERCTMHRLSGKCELIAIELARFKKVIQKRAAIAFRIAESRNKAGNAPVVFDGDLYEFAVAKKAVHAGVIGSGTRGLFLPIRVHLCTGQRADKKNETRELQRIGSRCADRHADLGTSVTGSIELANCIGSIAVMLGRRAKRDAGLPVLRSELLGFREICYWSDFGSDLFLGDFASSRETSSCAQAGMPTFPSRIICLALNFLPYRFSLAPPSERRVEPSSETPANSPLLRE